MEKTKNSTTLKAQLFSAIAMMLVATVALGTSTYAWFVTTAAPKVDVMQFQATSATSLTIALAKDATTLATPGTAVETDYKGVISNTDISTAYQSMWEARLVPASSVDTSAFFQAKSWDMEALKANVFESTTALNKGVKYIPLYLRSNKNMDVYLKNADIIAATYIAGNTIAPLTTQGVLDGNANADYTVTDGKWVLTESGATKLNGFYAEVKKALRISFVTDDAKVMFEPDSTGVVTGRQDTTIYESGTQGQAILTIDGNGKIATTGAQTPKAIVDYVVDEKSGTGPQPDVVDGTEAAGKTPLLQLTANAGKSVRVFIWLEGTDFDCVSAISDGGVAVNIEFIGGETPVVTP